MIKGKLEVENGFIHYCIIKDKFFECKSICYAMYRCSILEQRYDLGPEEAEVYFRKWLRSNIDLFLHKSIFRSAEENLMIDILDPTPYCLINFDISGNRYGVKIDNVSIIANYFILSCTAYSDKGHYKWTFKAEITDINSISYDDIKKDIIKAAKKSKQAPNGKPIQLTLDLF